MSANKLNPVEKDCPLCSKRMRRVGLLYCDACTNPQPGGQPVIKRDELSNPNSCMNRAGDDEMTFVLLGRDKAAPGTIRFWAAERVRLGKNSLGDKQILDAIACAESIERTQAQNS